METVMGVLFLAVPVAVVVGAVALGERRRRGRQEEVVRQIALTDAVHARMGAVVAPFVRRAGGRWQIAVAVPFERPAVVGGVLATVDEMFGRAPYEIVLSRQVPVAPRRPWRAAAVEREALSWT